MPPSKSPTAIRVLDLWFQSATRPTYQQIANEVGVSRQRVEQILNQHVPQSVAQRRLEREDRRVRNHHKKQERRQRVCIICGKPFEATTRILTCSPDCRDLYTRFRPLIVPAVHELRRRIVLFRSRDFPEYAAKSDAALPSLTVSNERLLRYYNEHGFMPPPRTIYLQKTSPNVARLIEKAGEERIRHWISELHRYYEGRPPAYTNVTKP